MELRTICVVYGIWYMESFIMQCTVQIEARAKISSVKLEHFKYLGNTELIKHNAELRRTAPDAKSPVASFHMPAPLQIWSK